MNKLIKYLEVRLFQPTPATDWIFVVIGDDEGNIGLGECSFSGSTPEVIGTAKNIVARLTRLDVAEAIAEITTRRAADAVTAAALAGVNQALCDLAARRAGHSLASQLGRPLRDELSFYANINRGIADRTARGFAMAARGALAAKVQAVKIAPFDGVTPVKCADASARELVAAGLNRIAAVKDALGPIPLMVDCHWRFDLQTATDVIKQVAEFDLEWFECPVPETGENLEHLRALRKHANDSGMKLAGGERVWALDQVEAFLDHEAYDVIMPDVKYTQSLSTFIAMGQTIQDAGVQFSPHNPTGPIAHAMTMEVCSLFENTGLIEYQHGETPLFDSIVNHTLPCIRSGSAKLDSDRTGLGLSLTLSSDIRDDHVAAR